MNVLLVFTDQQRADTIAALGNPHIVTPALDDLVSEAQVFERCYTPSPVCVPARLSMLSGQYPARTGCNNNNAHRRYRGEGFYAAFTKAGFDTCCVGKMHNLGDMYAPLGFQKRLTQEEIARDEDDYTRFIAASRYKNVFDYHGQRSELYYAPQVSQLPQEAHPTQWVGDRCLDYLREREKGKPWFLMASFVHPHPPFAPPAPWNKMYRNKADPAFLPENPADYEDLLRVKYTTNAVGISSRQLETLKNYYYACVSFVDYQIGRIVQQVKAMGCYEDTVIVFASDHGEMLGDYATMGKRTMLDPASHIPLLIRVPGMAPNRRKDPCSLVDIAPTLQSLAGIPYSPEEYDGLDLMRKKHETVFSQYSSGTDGEYMVAGEWDKLIYSAIGDRYFYFDSLPDAVDRFDENNPRVAHLRRLLDAYRQSDCCEHPATRPAVSPARIAPESYYPPLCDHGATTVKEMARMPEGYPIKLNGYFDW